jgi:hypothetical protein
VLAEAAHLFPGFPFVWDDLPIGDCTYMVMAVEAARAERAKQQ